MNIVDRVNLRTMRSSAAVNTYARLDNAMMPSETAVLARLAEEARGKPILDIGVGGGRTVAALKAISNDYLGIDNSPEMVAACKRRFPDTRFELADARKLSALSDESIYLAVFSCNGIGMVSHEDRLQILRQIHRVLQPGGAFVITTHNQNSPAHDAGFQFPQLRLTLNPLRMMVRLSRFLRFTVVAGFNRIRLRRHEVRTAEYSILNDMSHDYNTMLYYISLENQRLQLERAGFSMNAEAYDQDGALITTDSTDVSLALIARKPGAAEAARRRD